MTDNRFENALAAIDSVNAHDPRRMALDGEDRPYELAYAEQLTAWVRTLSPKASEALLLAARAQHIARWTKGRKDYPEGLMGYLQWREDLKHFHAEKAGSILETHGYDVQTIGHVQALIRKDNFPDHPESRVLEDALCLLFIETQLADFAKGKPKEKAIDILRKTWEKMTPRAQEIAQSMDLPDATKHLIQKAIGA